MALAANALMALDEARPLLGEKSQANDATLELLINAISQSFENRLNYKIVSQDVTGYRVDGTGRRHLYLPVIPVQAITKIDIRNEYDDTVYRTITDPTLFILKDSESGLVQLINDYFVAGRRNVLFDMTLGFDPSALELGEAKRLFLMQLSYDYKRFQNKEMGLLARSLPDGSVTFAAPTSLIREVDDGLDMMRVYRFH